MYCHECGEEALKNAKYCASCGTKLTKEKPDNNKNNTSTTGKESDDSQNISNNSDVNSKYIPNPQREVWLNLLTAGAYYLVWSWKAWWHTKNIFSLEVSPGWRGVFIHFNIHTLTKKLNRMREIIEKGGRISPGMMLTAAWTSVLLGNVSNDEVSYGVTLFTALLSLIITSIIIYIGQKPLREYSTAKKYNDKPVTNYWIYGFATILTVLLWLFIADSLFVLISG